MVEIKFGVKQINIKQKSIIKGLYAIRSWIIPRSFGWSELAGWVKICGPKNVIIFPNEIWFSEKPTYTLNYCSGRLQISKNYQIWCLLGEDLAFRDFCWLNFPTFSARGDKLKYCRILLLDLFAFDTCKGFFYLSVFLDFWKCSFWSTLPFENLWGLNCRIL